MNTKISDLSTGYVKRVKLLASMLHEPDIFIWDEPFSGIDKIFLPKLFTKIKALSSEGKFFIIASHNSQINSFEFPDSSKFIIINNKIIFDYEK